jgi:hypothetical protein
MYSCEIWADADPFCASADHRIRNWSDIHAMYWELYYYVTNILISGGRCIAVKVGQTLIHSVQVLIQSDCMQEGQEEDGSATETPKPKRGLISPQIQLTVDKFKKQS